MEEEIKSSSRGRRRVQELCTFLHSVCRMRLGLTAISAAVFTAFFANLAAADSAVDGYAWAPATPLNSLESESTCAAHAGDVCREPGSDWTQGPCNSIYGGYRGNADNLHQIMLANFQDSFRFLVLASHFRTDQVNRMGLHNLMQSYSDDMWNRGKEVMSYILKRGGRMGSQFKVRIAV